mgnify:CR=1 FL=1
MKYCSLCAHEVVRKIPEGEDRDRDAKGADVLG